MHIEFLAYPFLALALYFEVFLLLTFLSAPGRAKRDRPLATHTPVVSIIVPVWNEEKTIQGTFESLQTLEYPKDKLFLILVDDGSTDSTPTVLDTYAHLPHVTVLHKENGGKHSAINVGIKIAHEKGAEIMGCLDADSFVAPSALREMISSFDDPKVGATTPAMSVYKPKTILERMQNAEYIFGIGWRHALSIVNGIYVTPGPFSLYRLSVVEDLGGFRYAHQAEDMEMALRMQRNGWIIDNTPRARVYTKVPRSISALIKQRTRWTTGFLRNVLYDYRDLVGNPRYNVLGLMVLPLGFIAILGGITLFVVSIFQFLRQLVKAYMTTNGVPLSYTLMPHFSLSWFYFPVTVLVLLAFIAACCSVTFMLLGKKISNTPGNLLPDILAYAFFYGLIAPWWLMRAVRDVTIGTRRSWR